MQAKRYLHGVVSLSTAHKGKPRAHPVWVLRYRLPSGKDSRRTLGKAWLKASRPPANFMTRAQAEATAQRFLDEHATTLPDDRRTLRRALDDFIAHSERERKLRASTLAEYHRIANWLCARPWRPNLPWRDRPLDTFTAEDLLQPRAEMVDAGRNASTVTMSAASCEAPSERTPARRRSSGRGCPRRSRARASCASTTRRRSRC
jgi:hypothetical protein